MFEKIDELLERKPAPKRIVMVALLSVLLICICVCVVISSKTKRERLMNNLAEFGQSQFCQTDLSKFTDTVIRKTGLSDFECIANFSHAIYYDEEKNIVTIDCTIKMVSDDIDTYYTTEYNGTKANQLKNVLSSIYYSLQYIENEYSYNHPEGTVIVQLTSSEKQIEVSTTKGREYTYKRIHYNKYDYWSINIEIDNQLVYFLAID